MTGYIVELGIGSGTGVFQFFVPSSSVVHPVMWITWLNVCLILTCTGLSAYFAVKGRQAYRWLMFFNFLLGMMIICLYALFFADIYWKDFLSKTEVSLWIIKPMYTILMAGFLTNILVSGRSRR